MAQESERGKVVEVKFGETELPESLRFQDIGRLPDSLIENIVVKFDELGSSPEFLAILVRHLRDVYVYTSRGEGEVDLGVHQISPDGKASEWRRRMIIPEAVQNRYKNAVQRAIKKLDLVKNIGSHPLYPKAVSLINREPLRQSRKTRLFETSHMLAYEWIIYEQAAVMFANSIYMQTHFDHYIPDFNGQSPYVRSEYALALEFYKEYSSDSYLSPTDNRIMQEYENFKSGLGLLLLKDAALRQGAAASIQQANWLTNELLSNHPNKQPYDTTFQPFDAEELRFRVAAVRSRPNTLEQYKALLGLFDGDFDADDDDYYHDDDF